MAWNRIGNWKNCKIVVSIWMSDLTHKVTGSSVFCFNDFRFTSIWFVCKWIPCIWEKNSNFHYQNIQILMNFIYYYGYCCCDVKHLNDYRLSIHESNYCNWNDLVNKLRFWSFSINSCWWKLNAQGWLRFVSDHLLLLGIAYSPWKIV